MARARPIDYEKNFGIDMDTAIKKSGYTKAEIGKMTGLTGRSIYNKIEEPHKINLEWLIMFIKATGIHPDCILEYLYEGKYKVREN